MSTVFHYHLSSRVKLAVMKLPFGPPPTPESGSAVAVNIPAKNWHLKGQREIMADCTPLEK